jgi:integrase
MRVTYIERSPSNWRLRIEGARGMDGKRTFSYETIRGSEDDARRRRFEILKAHEDGSWAKPDKLTLGAFLERYLEQRQALGKICRGSAETYEAMLHANVLPVLGGQRLQRITGAEIQALYTALLTRKDRPLAPASVVLIHRVLKTAFKSARKTRLIVVNPMEEVEAPSEARATEEEITAKALDDAGTERLLREVAGNWKEDVVIVALGAGLRRGELCGLRWRYVDLAARKLLVAGQIVQYRDGTIEYKVPKTRRGRRSLSLPDPVVDVLRRLRAKAAAESMAAGRGSIDDAYVFSPDGVNPLLPNALTASFSRLCDNVGLPEFTFHGTRHTHITGLLKRVGREGAKAVSERVGHASVAFTLDRYQSVFEGDDRNLGDLAAGLFSGRGTK